MTKIRLDPAIYISGPYTTQGKHGNAIFTPNIGTLDDNVISLGTHENDCLGNIPLCPNGLTLSLWFKAEPQSHPWPHVFSSTYFTVLFNNGPGVLKLRTLLRNGTHQIWYLDLSIVAPNVWTHFGFTYTANTGINFFQDGCKLTRPKNPQIAEMTPVIKDFELGCTDGAHCAKITYDDFRFWTTAKDEQFMWWLSK